MPLGLTLRKMKISDFLGKQVDDVISVFGKEVTLSDDETIFLNDIYLEIPQRGICLISDRQSGEIYCAQLFGPDKDDSYEAFSGHVNGDLFFSDSQDAVRGKLGAPYKSSTGGSHVGNPWDLFVYSNFRIHCEYAPDGSRIFLISLQDVRSLVGIPASEPMVIVPEPSLLNILVDMEKRKGAPLTIEEVFDARDNCEATVMPRYFKLYKDSERGYIDIDVDNPWDSWTRYR